MTTAQETLTKHGIKLESYAPGRHYTTCPKCSHTRSTPNQKLKVLGITIGDDGSVCWGCNHCTYSGPEKGCGAANGGGRELQSHIYRDKDGVVRFRKVRNRPGREPRFWLERADGRGGWVKGTKDVNTKIIYRADEVTKAIADGRIIACAEGEKDCDNLWSLGFPATCNAHGASEPGKRPKWAKAHSEQLTGADLVVLNDNDAAGYEHADVTCKLSVGVAKRVRRLDLKPHWPEIPKGGDISDWLAAGHTREDLDKLIASAPDYQPSPEPAPAIDDAAEIEKLARMGPIEYDRARADAAKRLKIRASLLDALVKAKRAELGLDGGDGLQGRAIEFPDPEPWPEPVKGAELLDAIATNIRRHVVMSDAARDAGALWVVHTYLTDRFVVSPRLGVRSATKGCGKTLFLDVLGCLVRRPLPSASVTAATIFRVVESHGPTLLIDEADTFLRDNDELRGMLNSGHRRGGGVLRLVGDEHAPRAFATYGACAIALIGSLPDTLHDRAITVDLKRRLASEKVEPFRLDRAAHLEELARKAARWSQDNAERLTDADPAMPTNVINREADNWRPLLAIADAAGGEWPQRARKAAQAAHSTGMSDDALLELLLSDIRDVFKEKASRDVLGKCEEIASADLADELIAIAGHPWAEMGKGEKPLTQYQLARRLKPLGITTEKIGPGKTRINGYVRAHFKEAFERYLTEDGDSRSDGRTECDEIRTSEIFRSDSAGAASPSRKCEKSNNDGLPSDRPSRKGGNGETHTARTAEACAPRGPNSPEPCAYCGRPGGNVVATGDGPTHRLHRECEKPWLEEHMANEGIWRA
jgi:putative DNA primase/helicase